MQNDTVSIAISTHGDERPVLATGLRLARALGARIHLVHVVPTMITVGGYAVAEVMVMPHHQETLPDPAVLRRYAESELGEPLPDGTTAEVFSGDPVEDLRALSGQSTLLVVGHHHHGVLERLLGRSTDEQVLEGARCPVVVVPS